MANIFNANNVVLYNPGQYQSMQEKFFARLPDAKKFVEAFVAMNPNGQVKLCGWDKHTKTPYDN